MSSIERFETGISKNNLPNWGKLEALKELIQNNIYAKVILGDETEISHDGTFAVISNKNASFNKGKLLIGESDQAKIAEAPGNFGEGMKGAWTTLRRLGLRCHCETAGFTVRPEIEPFTLDSSVECLVFYIEENNLERGTTFYAECTKELLDEAVSYFAVLNGVDEDSTKKNVILGVNPKVIYINGVKIKDLHSIFGYNFVAKELMDGSRSLIDNDGVLEYVKTAISGIKTIPLAKMVLSNIMKDDTLIESQAGLPYYSAAYPEVWKSAGKSLFGSKSAIATGTDADTAARYRSFKILTGVPQKWKGFFCNTLEIPYANDLSVLRDTETNKNKHVKPDKDSNANLGWAKRMVKLYYGDYGTVKTSEVVVDEYGNECTGLWDPNTDITWMKKSVLQSKKATFKVLLHETIHRITGAPDNTEAFTEAWEDACWKILNRGNV